MAGTVVTGNVSTEEVLPDERVIDMDPLIKKLINDDSQFVTMTSRLPSKVATREKVNWLEEEDFPRVVQSLNAQLSTDTTMTLGTGQGKLVAANDLLRNMRTGEAIRINSITAGTDVIATMTRHVGNLSTPVAINAGDNFLVVADSQPQGSDFPSPRYLARVLGFNYTQITRTTWGFTDTQTAIELYGGREPGKEAVRQARRHKAKWEAIAFWGPRSFSAAVPPENEPQGSAGGAYEFITSNVKNVGGSLTPDIFDTWLMGPLQYGSSSEKVFFCAPIVAAAMSKWNRVGMGAQWDPSPRNIHGVQVDAFVSGAYGYRIPVVVKKEWASFPSNLSTPAVPAGFGSYGFLLDMSLISRRPLRDRDTKLLTEEQPKGKDTYNAEYLCEATYQFAHERAHGYLYGVTGGSNP